MPGKESRRLCQSKSLTLDNPHSNAPRIPPRPSWRIGGLKAWRTGEKGSWSGKWVLRGWKIGLWASKMTLGTSKLEAKSVPGGQHRDFEGLGTPKIGSWTVWKAVWRARGSSGRPSWGSKGRFGRHLGATWAPREAFRERFWRIWGSQTGPERRFFGSKVEKCKIAKSFVLPMSFQ